MYPIIKSLHALTAVITIAGFLLRGYWMLSGNPLLQKKLTRILPHVIDTLFLLSGVTLLMFLDGTPVKQPWMVFKITGLLVYIGLGTVALKRGKTLGIRATAFAAAVAVFAYTYGVAVSKSPASWIAILLS